MTNEEKSIELAENISPYDIGGDNAAHYAAKDAALDMADWKDGQYKQEIQKLIDGACEWLFKNDSYAIPTNVQVDRLREYLNKMK